MIRIDKPWGYELILHQSGCKTVKLIHADQDLSVQIHPNKSESFTVLNRWNKSAAIYVADLSPERSVELAQKIVDDPVIGLMAFEPYCTHEFDTLNIDSKVFHYISGGQEVIEVSKGEPITLRAYDWGRNSAERPLDTMEIIKLFEL